MNAKEMYLLKADHEKYHGDEHLAKCFGDCDIWCTCDEKRAQELEAQQEDYYINLVDTRWNDC